MNKISKRILTVPVFLVLLVIGIASAGMIAEYFSVSGTVTTTTPLTVTGDLDLEAPGGSTIEKILIVTNAANNPITAIWETTVTDDELINIIDAEEGISVSGDGVTVTYSTDTFAAGVDTEVTVTITTNPGYEGHYAITAIAKPIL